MKIVIFGGCGFIATNTALEALKRGHEVYAFDSLVRRFSEENVPILEAAGVTVIRGDVRNVEDFKRLPDSIDGAINFAANPGIPWSIDNPTYDFKVNAMGALTVLEYSRASGNFPVVLASTNKVYSEEINEISYEETETRYQWKKGLSGIGWSEKGIAENYPMDSVGRYAHSPYGVSKSSADLYHQEYFHAYGVPTVINRMSCIYGYYQKGVADQGWVDHFLKRIIAGEGLDIFGDGKQVRDMLFGEDVARLYIDELEKIDIAKGNIFNVGGGVKNTISLIESIRFIEELVGQKIELTYHDWRLADQKIYISDISKVERIMDWHPTITPQEGIERMYKKLCA